ncbi:MAG: hypothetical protein KI785_12805 [Devosiaceae bacterium]|nr:hypothetical protein [Devosiaceae bacterium MH13]
MLSVIIRTHNGEHVLLEVLRPLISAAAEGFVRDVAFVDFGSQDGTALIADAAGATLVAAAHDPLADALEAAPRGGWVLLLDQRTVLSAGWLEESLTFVERQERVRSSRRKLTGCFRPEHEPEEGSADLRRRLAVLALNRLASSARLSQGILIRRADLKTRFAGRIDWQAGDPALRVPNLLRLRSRSHLAQPLSLPSDTADEQSEAGVPAGQASV